MATRLPSDWSASETILGALTECAEFVLTSAIAGQLDDDDATEVGLLLTDDGTLHRLNRDYRGIDTSTDVLAFSMREGVDGELHPELLGDIAISVPTALRQAGEQGHSLARELAFLVVHGLLHLLGHDDATDEEALAMNHEVAGILAAVTSLQAWATHESNLSTIAVEELA